MPAKFLLSSDTIASFNLGEKMVAEKIPNLLKKIENFNNEQSHLLDLYRELLPKSKDLPAFDNVAGFVVPDFKITDIQLYSDWKKINDAIVAKNTNINNFILEQVKWFNSIVSNNYLSEIQKFELQTSNSIGHVDFKKNTTLLYDKNNSLKYKLALYKIGLLAIFDERNFHHKFVDFYSKKHSVTSFRKNLNYEYHVISEFGEIDFFEKKDGWHYQFKNLGNVNLVDFDFRIIPVDDNTVIVVRLNDNRIPQITDVRVTRFLNYKNGGACFICATKELSTNKVYQNLLFFDTTN